MSIMISRRHFLGSAALAGGLSALPAWARATPWAGVDSMLSAWVARGYAPGAGAAIARGTDPAVFLTTGNLAQGSAVPVGVDTLWRCYSMTKPITGMAAMLLIEDGKLKLDQNIADFMPAFANPRVMTEPDKSLASRPSRAPITVRTLLTHTAGLGYSIVTKGPLLTEYLRLGLTPGAVSRTPMPGTEGFAATAPSLAEFADRLATTPLIADPGSRWSYSVSLDLLGRLIEVVSGEPFDAFVQRRILDPLGMKDTFWQVPEREVGRLTTNYFATPAGPFAIDPGATSIYLDKPAFAFGGAGLVSTMRDYDRFLAMLMGEGAIGQNRIMARETAIAAMSNLLHPDTEVGGYVKGQGFGAGGRVTLRPGANGEGVGTFGWGGAASTIGWVDRTRGVRASGWIQVMTSGEQPFTIDFGKSVYQAL